MCILHYFNYQLPDLAAAISLGSIFGFSFLGICFNLTQCHYKPLVESSFLTRDQALSLQNRGNDSKTLDHQRTNPREYQIVRTHTKETIGKQDLASPNHRQQPMHPHLNNKQNKNANPVISRQDYHLTQPCPSEEKQTNKQTKNSTQISPHRKLTQTTEPILGGQKTKGRKNSTLKPGKRRPQTQ